MIVQILAIDADIAIGEIARDVGFDLAAAGPVIADIARPIADMAETADMESRVGIDAAAIVEIGAEFAIVQPGGQAERAAFARAGLGDEVDDAARRIRREGRSRPAAHRFDPCDGIIGAKKDVGIAERDVAEFEDWEPVFLELEELRTARGDRQAAHGDIGIALAA